MFQGRNHIEAIIIFYHFPLALLLLVILLLLQPLLLVILRTERYQVPDIIIVQVESALMTASLFEMFTQKQSSKIMEVYLFIMLKFSLLPEVLRFGLWNIILLMATVTSNC